MKLEDIALKAGVSRSTVSRVINGEPYVSERTRVKVMAVIEEEGFSPNPAARMLVKQRSNIVGVVIPESLEAVFFADSPFYFATILQSASQVLHERGYAMLLWMEHSRDEMESLYQRIISNRLMDGLLIVSSVAGENTLIDKLVKSETPFVMLGRPMSHADKISYVSIDNVQAAKQAVHHLYKLGRRRIAKITGNMENVDAQDRLIGYKKAMTEVGLPLDENLIVEGRFVREWGYLGAQQLLKRNIDAIVAASDTVADGALQAIQEAGLRVPEDIAIVGFDDMPVASQMNPPLTTIRHPIGQKGTRATALLIDLIEGKLPGPQQTLLPTQLVIRQSCGAEKEVYRQ